MASVPFWDSRVVMQLVKVGIVVGMQLAIAFLKSPWSNRFFKQQAGWDKLKIVSGLGLVLGLPVFSSIGLDVGDSLFQSLEAVALAVYGHQIIQNKKEDNAK